MTPEDIDARLGRLETSMARIEQQVASHETDIRAIGPMAITIAKLELSFGHVEAEIRAGRADTEKCRGEVAALRESLTEREDTQRQERKRDRWTLIGTVIAASTLIVAAVGLLVG